MKQKSFYNHTAVILVFLFLVVLLSGTPETVNGALTVYPAKGQTPEQQKQDEFECHQWAVDQNGFDPTKENMVSQQKPAPQGGALRGAAGGALVGAGIGAIAGNTAKGAAIGAGTGALGGGARQQKQRQQQESITQQTQQNQQALLDKFNKSRAACLEGRGYTVK